MLIMTLLLIVNIFTMYVLKKKLVTILGIFYIGHIIFNNIGWIIAYILIEKVYVIQGNYKMLENIIFEIYLLNSIIILLLILHAKTNLSVDRLKEEISIVVQKNSMLLSFLTIFTATICIVFFLMIDMGKAPLFNIGKYSFEEMKYYRQEIFNNDILKMLNVVKYLVLYVTIPLIYLKKGLGIKHNIIFDIIFITFSLLTLSKTAFTLILVFYWIGKYLSSSSIKYLIALFVSISLSFYLIVYATYYVDVRRDFQSVFEILIIRLLASPISLSALYSQVFSFEQGYRSSTYYALLFGGNVVQIPIIAMQNIDINSKGNAPTGIIGSAFPNIPFMLHWLYYLIFGLYIFIISMISNKINNILLSYILVPLLGILTWFIYLTDPLVALNSYGIIYLSVVIIIIKLLQPKRNE